MTNFVSNVMSVSFSLSSI